MIIDSHAHLFNEYYDNIKDVLDRAKAAGIIKVVNAADTIASCKEVIDNANKYEDYYFCLGIHPENVDEDINELEKLIEDNKDNPKFVAIGEIGLDYYWTKDNKDKQIELFENQLKLAEKYNKPVVVHSREATQDTIDILGRYNITVYIHCFSGSKETADIYVKRGYYIGVGGVLTFKNAKIKDVIKDIPLENLLLETDAPYLAPTPYRGKPNEPAYLLETAKFLAEVKEESLENIDQKILENSRKIFSI
ncbi:MAG: TatD family hydrolase [Bacilli bacterium]|nr:TatD family hydrolase [Bacilli bacterium]